MPHALKTPVTIIRYEGERGTYHLVKITGEVAAEIAEHAFMERMEFGRRRGFGSVKIAARIGGSLWKTSLFPQNQSSEWIMLVSKKIMRAEDLAAGDEALLEVALV